MEVDIGYELVEIGPDFIVYIDFLFEFVDKNLDMFAVGKVIV